MSASLLIDNSAWARLWDGSLPESRVEEVANKLDLGDIAFCLPLLLEAGYSARGANDHDRFYDGMVAFPWVYIDKRVERRALDAQSQLSRIGHHRMPSVDLIIAALADRHELGVLHYDNDFEVILEKTDLEFQSEWLMPRGSL